VISQVGKHRLGHILKPTVHIPHIAPGITAFEALATHTEIVAEIAELEKQMIANPEARIPQKALAEELTTLIHGEDGLKTAQAATNVLFGGSIEGLSATQLESIFKDVKSAEMNKADIIGKPVFAAAATAKMFASNSDARRMAQQGGLSLNSEKIGLDRVFEEKDFIDGRVAVLRSGKKNYFLLKVV
jgi:tyrosyl-tRNA synthetase